MDYESGDANHGVRQYSQLDGRFYCPDALWEKYYSLSPYNYCGNNPVMFFDDNGLDFAFFTIKMNDDGTAAGGGYGHTRLYFQDGEQWYQYDQGAWEHIACGHLGLFLGFDAGGGVKIRPVKSIPEEAVIFKSSPDEDKLIKAAAYQSKADHNDGDPIGAEILYSMYYNNCTDAAVDVIEKALGIEIYNPWYIVAPNTWFAGLKEWKAERDKKIEEQRGYMLQQMEANPDFIGPPAPKPE